MPYLCQYHCRLTAKNRPKFAGRFFARSEPSAHALGLGFAALFALQNTVVAAALVSLNVCRGLFPAHIALIAVGWTVTLFAIHF